uniref:Neural cell adhesion molecule L1-like protein n=1 Tax=Cyprinus carpio TaxID=7962 RepID=A0A8C2KP05_CYPCA
MSCKYQSNALDIPLEVEQLPTITEHSPASLIAFPFEESFPMKCEATGNPGPEFRWTKNGEDFDPYQDPRLITLDDSGTFIIPNNGNLTEFQGNYRCFATNKLGTAMSEEIEFIVPNVPKFPKEITEPIEVMEGQSVILECNPPKGIPPLQIYWMTMSLQHIEQDERVSMGLNGNLYFSNAIKTDSRRDYCCFAAFPRIRTIVQKNAMSVVVKSTSNMSVVSNSLLERKPSLLTPTGKESHTYLVKGEDLQLECIAEGFPTPEVEWVKIGFHKLPERAVVESHGKLLTVEMVNEEDEGKYMCRAKNPHGEVVHYFYVTVEADVVIKCVVKGNPQPSVAWRVNGQPLNDVPTSNRKILKDGTISIHNAKPENSAVYQCEATNRHGTILANANIMIMIVFLDVPDPPEDVIHSEHNGRSVKLQWIPGDDHNSSITEFVIEFEESQHEPGSWRELMRVPGNHHSAQLKLHSHVDYRFRVYAINEVGRGRPSQATERYKTPASAPDKNPENIKIEGHLPHEMDINWEPLSPIEHNGPGLEYKVSYRRQGNGEDWKEHMVKRHSFLVKNTPTFVLYEIKIQAKNHMGWGPDPKIITAYSGEDFPSAAPEDVAVDVMNNTMMQVKWAHVHKDKLNGHLGGYRISYWRLRSLLDSKKTHGDKHTLTFSGERNHAVVTGLRPFSEYSLIVMAFNSRGNGPGSHPVSFKTPEGVAAFSVTSIQKHKVTLTWSPPVDANGVIIGYILQYQLINDTEEQGSLMSLNISADSNKLHLQYLEALSKYKFYLRCCTQMGCGPAVSEERTTVPEASEYGQQLLGVGVSRGSQPVAFQRTGNLYNCVYIYNRDFIVYLHHFTHYVHPVGEGNWKISDALNSSKTFHIIEGLEPGTEYTVRLMTKSWVKCSQEIFLSLAGLASIHGGISNQGWFIGLMCAIALLTLIVLIACFVNRNKGGKYSVKEKEDLHPDLESPGINDDTFCEYSDNDEKPLKSSQHSLNGDLKGGDSGDSMVDYGDEDAHFHEDGSFIGEYSGRKDRVSMEIKGNNQSTA